MAVVLSGSGFNSCRLRFRDWSFVSSLLLSGLWLRFGVLAASSGLAEFRCERPYGASDPRDPPACVLTLEVDPVSGVRYWLAQSWTSRLATALTIFKSACQDTMVPSSELVSDSGVTCGLSSDEISLSETGVSVVVSSLVFEFPSGTPVVIADADEVPPLES
jgi:hypothetical protein